MQTATVSKMQFELYPEIAQKHSARVHERRTVRPQVESVESYFLSADNRTIKRRIAPRRQRRAHVTSVCKLPTDELALDLVEHAEYSMLRRSRKTRGPSKNVVRVVDLFSGCGGMSLGVRDACDALGMRFLPVGAFDTNRSALRVYHRNFGGREMEPVNLGEILRRDPFAPVNIGEVSLIKETGVVDIVVAGPPCQGHSNLNNVTRRADPRNELYSRVARFAALARPKWIIIENVIGVTKDREKVVARTKAFLELNYTVIEGIVDCQRIGVPQTRRRHILLAGLKSAWPGDIKTMADVVERYARPTRTLRWAIGDLTGHEARTPFDQPSKSINLTRERIDFLFDNECYDLPDSQRPDCHRLKPHTYQSVYGRTRWDEPAPTITGGFGTMGRGRFVHPEERRTFTPHEAARIQGFPDLFDFSDVENNRGVMIELIGNAVPPRLAYIMALECLR